MAKAMSKLPKCYLFKYFSGLGSRRLGGVACGKMLLRLAQPIFRGQFNGG
jgi:hypothetical protein